MIFQELVLHNFGVYQGRREISLAVEANKPIVLIGALNGGGKTTFLDAMQLALYGKGAKCTGRERVGYHDYLSSMINRNVPPSHGAGVELSFQARAQGHDSTIRVVRTWQQRGQDIRESFEVLRDGIVDAVASDRWQEFVEDFMPSQIADLFFFDGEKIEALADPQRSAALLRVGVHSLLGIDLVEELGHSLQHVEKRKKTSHISGVDRQGIENLQQQIGALQNEKPQLIFKRDAFEKELEAARKHLDNAHEEFRRVGGELFQRRHELLAQKTELTLRRDSVGGKLRDLSATTLPLCFCFGLVGKTIDLARQDENVRVQQTLLSEAEARDKTLVQHLKKVLSDRAVIGEISLFLELDRATRYSQESSASIPLVPVSLLTEFNEGELERLSNDSHSLLDELSDVNERLANVERHLLAMPDDAVILQAQQALDACRVETALLNEKIVAIDTERATLDDKVGRLEQQLNREMERLSQHLLDDDMSIQIVKQSMRARETLAKFRERLLYANLEKLQIGIQSFFQMLLRKRKLVHGISIDPESFQLSVLSEAGQVVPAHRLSAGERQLLAVATLWALAHASGRHLPAVIDTPLSRLDSRHRETLVKHYFPFASHQVILLSTDKEVVGEYLDQLEPFLGRRYLIDHDEELGTSKIQEGYFSSNHERSLA